MSESLPAGAKLVKIEAYPAAIELTNRFDYRQVLADRRHRGGRADRRHADGQAGIAGRQTRRCTVSPTGLVRPTANGAAN